MIIFLKVSGVLIVLLSLLVCIVNPILGIIGIIAGVLIFIKARSIVEKSKAEKQGIAPQKRLSKKELKWEQEQKERNERLIAHIKERKLEFDEELSHLPVVSIEKDLTNTLTKNTLSDMPEIKFKSITKSFNPDTLPAFVVIDTETTGLSGAKDKIVELSAVAYEEFVPVRAFSTLINPKTTIPEKVSEMHGIYNDTVANAPTINEISPAFIDFIGTLPIVGYNTAFDMKFLWVAGINEIFANNRKFYDVLDIARKTIPNDDIDAYNLTTVADYYDIYFDNHKSLNDCFATGKVFKKLIDEKTI